MSEGGILTKISTMYRDIPVATIELIVFCPNPDEPGIAYGLTSGEMLLNVFSDDAECARKWENIALVLVHNDFFRCPDTFIRIAAITTFEKRVSPELGAHIEFVFQTGRQYVLQYEDSVRRDEEFAQVTEVLAALQETRATSSSPAAKQ